MEYGYKIRNGAGQYRLSGAMGLFSKRGKVWNSFGAVKSHLRMTAGHREYCNESVARQRAMGIDVQVPYPEVIPADWVVVRIGDGQETTIPAQAVLDGARFAAEASKTTSRLSFSFLSAEQCDKFLSKITQLAEDYGMCWTFDDDDALNGRFWQDGGTDDDNAE